MTLRPHTNLPPHGTPPRHYTTYHPTSTTRSTLYPLGATSPEPPHLTQELTLNANLNPTANSKLGLRPRQMNLDPTQISTVGLTPTLDPNPDLTLD